MRSTRSRLMPSREQIRGTPRILKLRSSERNQLKVALNRLYGDFNRVDSASDPVHIVRRYTNSADREVVAFCSAALAFGRIASILGSIDTFLSPLGETPAAFIRSFDPSRDAKVFDGLVHRWIRGVDFVALLWILRLMLEQSDSIQKFFLEGYDSSTSDLGNAIDSFSERARAMDLRCVYGVMPRRPGFWYFFPRPSAGSGCKRINLFLRWMIRRDDVDLGIWSKMLTPKLIVPLDTHVIRVAQCLRLTRYRSPGWRMAEEITASLRVLDPSDPVKYDFALCHLGIVNACGFSRTQEDENCPLQGVCQPTLRK